MKLGMLYRKYLRGEDIKGKTPVVEIAAFKLVQVQPHPTAPKQDKWCLYVKGLPADLPPAILVGPKGEARLVELFGQVELDELKGKRLELFTYEIKIGGDRKQAIGFRLPKNGKAASVAPPAAPNPAAEAEPPEQPPDEPTVDFPF